MTDQPNPEATESSLQHAEETAAREAAQQATGEMPVQAGDDPVQAATGESATKGSQMPQSGSSAVVGEPDIDAKVTRARPRTSEPVAAQEPTREAPTEGGSGSGRHRGNGSGNGRHKEIVQSSAEMVRAETVSVHQGSVQTVNAESIDVRQGAVARVDARDVSVTGGAIALARGERISIELGAAGAAIAGEAHVTQGAVNAVVAREAHVEQSLVQTVIANDVRFDRPSAVVFLLARRVEGEMRAIFDWRGGLAFGLGAGLVMSILRRRR
jgi:hypothetical protein